MTTVQSTELHADDVAAIDELRQDYQQMCEELGKVIVGQQSVIEQLAICLFARGHALLMGVPGLAKTLLVRRLAETMDLSFSRIQFTPDLMPMDITGTDILQESGTGRREFEFAKGPVFANIVLADEINRAPSKTQAAMLEAMQEHRVTVVGRTYTLEEPFFVLATQNPIEQEGTYPLPEAQLDRFMFMIQVNYPELNEEIEIGRTTTGGPLPELKHIIDGGRVLSLSGTGATRSCTGAHLRVRRASGAAHPPLRPGIAGMGQAVGQLGSGPAGRAIPDSGCQVPRRVARQLHGAIGRRGRGGGAGLDASSDHLLCRRIGGDRQPTDRSPSGR